MDCYAHNFSCNVRHLRQSHRLTQRDIARILGISTGKLRRIEQEQPPFRITATMLCRLCDHFPVSADALLRQNWQESPVPSPAPERWIAVSRSKHTPHV